MRLQPSFRPRRNGRRRPGQQVLDQLAVAHRQQGRLPAVVVGRQRDQGRVDRPVDDQARQVDLRRLPPRLGVGGVAERGRVVAEALRHPELPVGQGGDQRRNDRVDPARVALAQIGGGPVGDLGDAAGRIGPAAAGHEAAGGAGEQVQRAVAAEHAAEPAVAAVGGRAAPGRAAGLEGVVVARGRGEALAAVDPVAVDAQRLPLDPRVGPRGGIGRPAGRRCRVVGEAARPQELGRVLAQAPQGAGGGVGPDRHEAARRGRRGSRAAAAGRRRPQRGLGVVGEAGVGLGRRPRLRRLAAQPRPAAGVERDGGGDRAPAVRKGVVDLLLEKRFRGRGPRGRRPGVGPRQRGDLREGGRGRVGRLRPAEPKGDREAGDQHRGGRGVERDGSPPGGHVVSHRLIARRK